MKGHVMNLRLFSCLTLLFLLFTACSTRLYSRPPGERIGSCSGRLRPEERRPGKFTIEVYRSGDDITAYFTMARLGIHRGRIIDVELNDGKVELELTGPHRSVEGTLLMDNFAIEGTLEPWFGNFRLELRE